MPESLYDQVPCRDALAGERTVLAAERTFLAYVRTGFAMFITGVTGSQLLTQSLLVMLGYALTVLSVVVFLFGVVRFQRSRATVRKTLSRMREE